MSPLARKYQRGATAPARTVALSLDGQSFLVSLTRAEERKLRADLRPFVAAARVVTSPADSGGGPHLLVSERLRAARVQALLSMPGTRTVPTREQSKLDALLSRTAEVYAKSLADQTRSAYRRRWRHFEQWCAQRQLDSMPAEPATVMIYLADQLDGDPPPSLSTLRGRASAINRVHVEMDQPPPGDDPALTMLMRGLSRSVRGAPAQEPMSALRVEELRAVCAHLDHPDPVVVRDAALVRLHLAGIAPSDLARLRWRDIRFDQDVLFVGVRARLDGEPHDWRRIEAGVDERRSPVAALQRWRAIASDQPPLIFTLVDRLGRRDARGLRKCGVQRVLSERVSSLVAQHGEHAQPLASAADLLHEVANDVLRDRALLLVGFAGAFRRGDLTRLVWDDVRFVDDGLVVHLRRSKTDVMGRGRDVGIPLGRSLLTCPVRAMRAWRDRMQHQLRQDYTGTTCCFPRIGKAGRITAEHPLTNEGLTMVVRRRMTAAGIEGRWGGRSLRAGFISTAADLDLPLELIATQSGHASLDSLVRYIRAEDLFRRNAVDRVGL